MAMPRRVAGWALAFVPLLLPISAMAGTTIKLSLTDNPQPFESPMMAMAVVFKNVLERETNEQIKVNIHPSSQLGSEREVLESVKIGAIQAQVGGEGGTANFFPPIQALGVPYLFPSIRVAFKVMDGPFGRQLLEQMRKDIGVRTLAASAPGPFRNFAANKPLRKVEDLKGLRIRVIENPAYQAMVNALGASATPIPFGELYSAMKSGVVDGFELPYQAVLNMKLEEVAKHMIVDQHLFQHVFLFVSDKWFAGLPEEHKKAVLRAAEIAEIASRGQVYVWEAVGAEELQRRGLTLYYPSREELDKFRKMSQPAVISMLSQRIDKKWIEGIQKAVEDASR